MKVQFGLAVTDGRNKCGDVVYSRNRWGVYTKKYFKPRNPKSAFQTTFRNLWKANFQLWQSITEDQRKMWLLAAQSQKRSNNLGQKHFMSGFNYFMQINTNINFSSHASTPIPVPYILPISLPACTLIASGTAGALSLNFSPALPNSGHMLYVAASACLSPGRMVVTRQPRYIASWVDSGQTSIDILSAWATIHGLMIVGKKIFVRIFVTNSSGAHSIPVTVSAIVSP